MMTLIVVKKVEIDFTKILGEEIAYAISSSIIVNGFEFVNFDSNPLANEIIENVKVSVYYGHSLSSAILKIKKMYGRRLSMAIDDALENLYVIVERVTEIADERAHYMSPVSGVDLFEYDENRNRRI